MKIQVVGMAWYRPENFEQLRAIFTDGHKLHATYSEWLKSADRTRKLHESQGIKVVCVDIDPVEFPKWCLQNGKNIDAGARIEYASIEAFKVFNGSM